MNAAQTSTWDLIDFTVVNVSPSTPPPSSEWDRIDSTDLKISPGMPPPAESRWDKLDVEKLTLSSGVFTIPPGYQLVESTVYPDGKTYNGPAERCYASLTFLPANWPGATWFIDRLLNQRIADKLSEAGAKPLNFKLYEMGFNYIVVIEASKPTVQSAMPVIQIGWSVIILSAFILAALIVIFFTIKMTLDFIYKSPLAAGVSGLIFLGLGAIAVIGIAASKGSSVKQAVTGKR